MPDRVTKPIVDGSPSTSSRAAILDDGDVQLYHGDVIDVLRQLPAGIAQTCITSPPYWGLRDYGTGEWTGGDAACGHRIDQRPFRVGREGNPHGTPPSRRASQSTTYADECGRCGARRVDSQLGLEATPDLYVERLVAVFREVWRVLRDDGTVWLNLGDSYAGSWGAQSRGENSQLADRSVSSQQIIAAPKRANTGSWVKNDPVVKPKDLVGIPWRVAFALQDDGWYLRSDIVWSKPNPMPESVTDRPTKAHEYLFLLAKRPRYFYDADSIREPHNGLPSGNVNGKPNPAAVLGQGDTRHSIPWEPGAAGRNRRSVWTIPTEPFPEAHFATYPQALVRPCILAGSRPGDTILDPFIGSGTTALVARNHGRRCIGIDLSAEYLAIAAKRLQQLSLLAGVDSG